MEQNYRPIQPQGILSPASHNSMEWNRMPMQQQMQAPTSNFHQSMQMDQRVPLQQMQPVATNYNSNVNLQKEIPTLLRQLQYWLGLPRIDGKTIDAKETLEEFAQMRLNLLHGISKMDKCILELSTKIDTGKVSKASEMQYSKQMKDYARFTHSQKANFFWKRNPNYREKIIRVPAPHLLQLDLPFPVPREGSPVTKENYQLGVSLGLKPCHLEKQKQHLWIFRNPSRPAQTIKMNPPRVEAPSPQRQVVLESNGQGRVAQGKIANSNRPLPAHYPVQSSAQLPSIQYQRSPAQQGALHQALTSSQFQGKQEPAGQQQYKRQFQQQAQGQRQQQIPTQNGKSHYKVTPQNNGETADQILRQPTLYTYHPPSPAVQHQPVRRATPQQHIYQPQTRQEEPRNAEEKENIDWDFDPEELAKSMFN